MFRRAVPVFACILALSSAVSLASAQANKPVQQQQLTEDALVQILQDLKLNPKEQSALTGKYWTFEVRPADGWIFVMEVRPIRGANGQLAGYTIVSPLGQPLSNQASANQLRRILEAVYTQTNPCSFALRPSDGRLCMILDCPFTTITQQAFQSDLNLLMGKIRSTRNVWDIN